MSWKIEPGVSWVSPGSNSTETGGVRGLVSSPQPAIQGGKELWKGFSERSVALRLFLTCWLIFGIHFSPYVYRELYTVMGLAERHTVHVDEYMGLHPDLFEMPGRGTYMGGNPGAPLLAAIPYWVFLPVVNRVAPVRPPDPAVDRSSQVVDLHPNEYIYHKFLRRAHARGLEKRLGAAAAITSVFFMAPVSALSVVVMFWLLRRFRFSTGHALGMALLYALGTPIFFRTAMLNLNLLVALLGLFSFALLWPRSKEKEGSGKFRYLAAGSVAGWALLTDYSGVVTVVVLGVFALAMGMGKEPFWAAFKRSLWFVVGALGPVAILLFWQWYCYGSAWLPAQFHMPKKYYMGYRTDRGFGLPQPRLLWGLLFDPLYGLLVFCPMLSLALYHFVLVRRRKNRVPWGVGAFAWAFFVVLWIFCSCIEYTVRFQWMDGVRYMVPAVPFLFLLVADVLENAPRAMTYLVVVAAVAETWCLAMVRQNPLGSMVEVFTHGPELPWHTTLIKSAARDFPSLSGSLVPTAVLLAGGVAVWAIWWIGKRRPAAAQV